MASYIGKKGYTIVKSSFSVDEVQVFRNELNVKPNQNMNGFMNSVQYPIYRESTHKMYLPRYYGIEKIGHCNKNVLSKGTPIDLPFEGSLFDYQVKRKNRDGFEYFIYLKNKNIGHRS